MKVAQVPAPSERCHETGFSRRNPYWSVIFAPNAGTALSSMTRQILALYSPVLCIIYRLHIILRYVPYTYEKSSLNKVINSNYYKAIPRRDLAKRRPARGDNVLCVVQLSSSAIDR